MKTIVYTRSELDTGKWDAFIHQSPQGSAYAVSDWLDIVSPDWSAIVVEGHQGWQAVFPMPVQKRSYGRILVQPPYTQHLGPILKHDPDRRPVSQSEQQNDILRAIGNAIPSEISFARIACSPNSGPVIPFHWFGYRLETRYTYRQVLDFDTSSLLDGMHSKKRNSIRKGEQQLIEISDTYQEDTLKASFSHAGYLGVSERALLLRLAATACASGRMVQYTAISEGNVPTGTVLVAFFRDVAYLVYQQYILSDFRGVMDALIWRAMLASRERGARIFDFEGSMLEPVEKVFREFGGKAEPYLVLEKDRRPAWYRVASRLRSLR